MSAELCAKGEEYRRELEKPWLGARLRSLGGRA